MPDNNKIPLNNTDLGVHPLLKNSALPIESGKPYLAEIGDTDFGNSKYDKESNISVESIKNKDYQYFRGEQQSGLGQIGLGVLRALSKAAVETGKTPAYLYSLGEWSLDNISKGGKGVTLDQALDNAWLNTLESLDDSIKNELPVYHSYKSGKGGILDNIASTSFWSSEGADGVGYLLGLMAPGAALKGLNLASKISKLGVGVELSKDIELGTLTLLNSSVEALAEAKGVADRLKAEGASPEQIAEATKETFYANLALLLLPNAVMNKNLLGRFKADKSMLDEFKDVSGKLMVNPVIKKDALKQYFKSIFGSALPEGVIEEGGQTTIENYEVAKATGKTDLGFIEGVANEFLTTMTTTEGLKSVVLGSVLGSFGGAVGTFKQRKADQEYRNKNFGTISQLIKDNFEGFSGDNEIYDRDENGVQTSINPTKLKEATEDFINEITESKLKDLSALNDDKVLHDYLDNKIFTRAAIPFLKLGDVGLELLNDKIDNASLTASKINQLDILDENKYKTEQKNKAKQLLGLYNDTMNVVSQFASVKALEGREGYEEYLDKMFNASFQEVSKQVFYKEKIQDLNNELSKYNSVIFNDLPQNQIQVAKYQKQIDGLNKLLEQSKEKYNSLQNTSEQIKALNEFIEQKVKSEKIVKDVQNAEKESIKKQEDKQILDELKSDVTIALESMTIDEFDSLYDRLKNDPLVNEDQKKALAQKEQDLNDIVDLFVEHIKDGNLPNDDETKQFYANNKTHIEKRLLELKAKDESKKLPSLNEVLNNTNKDLKADIERRRQEDLNISMINTPPGEQNGARSLIPLEEILTTGGRVKTEDDPSNYIPPKKAPVKYYDLGEVGAFISEEDGIVYLVDRKAIGSKSKGKIIVTKIYLNKKDKKFSRINTPNVELIAKTEGFNAQESLDRLNKAKELLQNRYDAELAALENNQSNNVSQEEQELISENNQLVVDDETSQKHPITDNQVESKGINRKNNVAMMHLFEHYFENDFFKFKRQEGFPKLDNTSNINIKSINDIKIGDTINFKFVEVSPEISSLYEGLKDYDGKHIGIYKDNELLGFVQQPHEISTKSSDPDLSKRLRDGLIAYRKHIIKELNSNKEVVEKVLDKGTGNLYTKLDKQGRIDPIFDVLDTARTKDKIENQLVFVYSNSLGKLTLPDNTDLDKETINNINLRLAKLNKFDSKKGRVFQLVKDLNDDWSPIPVYPNVLNKETLDKITEVLSTSNNDNEPNDIIRRLQPYIYSTEFKRGVPITIKKEGGVIKLWNANGLVTLDEFQNNKFKNKSFLEGLKGVKQNISINDINKPSFQEDMKNRKSLLTNVTTFEGEYFVQPYIEYTQSISKKLNEASAQDNIELDQLQPSINDTDLNSKVKDKLKSIDLDTPINDDNALSINHDNTLLNKVKFQKWLSSRLPQLKLSDVDSIYQLKDVMIDSFGLFRDSTIYLFEGAGMKTAYHEAFHGVFRNLLTVKQRQDIINEAVSKYPQPTELEINNLKQGLKNKYSSGQLLYLYYEEKLADDFAKYAYDRNDSNFWVKLGNKIKDFFNKIFNFYRIFKSNDTTTIDGLFSNINAGRLATLNSKSNSVVNRSLFNEYAYSKALNGKLGVSTKVKIVKSIGNKFLAEYQQAIFNEQKVDSFSILKNIQNSYKKQLVSGKLSEADEKECARIIVNFPDIWNEVKKYLEYRNIKSKLVLGYNTIKEEIEVQEEGILEFKTDLTQESIEDVETYSLESKTVKGLGEWTSISGLSSASTRLKLFLSSIPIIKDGDVVKDNLGVTQYHEFSDLYYYIERNLIDKYELSEQLSVLKELAINRPVLNQIIDKLSNKPSEMSQEQFDLLINDFKTNFSKQQLAYTLIKFDNENGNYNYKIIDANRSSLGREIFNQFEINVADPTKDVVGYYDKDGNRVIDASKAKDVLQSWDKLFSKVITYESVNALLNKVGIEYTPEVLKKILSSDISIWKNQVTTLMKWYASDFPINEEKEGRKALSQLVAYEVDNLMEKYTSSFINGENKNIYTIQLPSFISKTVAKIKNRDKFKLWKADLQKDDFYYKSNLLEALDNKEYRDSFKISYMDSFKDERGSREGVGFTSLTPKDYLNTQVALFQNTAVNSQKQTTMPVSKYIYITPSDKTMCVIIDAGRYDVAIDPIDGSDLDLRKSPIFDKYYNVVLSEAIRIAKANNVKNDIIANKGEGKYNLNELEEHYHMSKSSFKKLSNMILEDKLDWDIIPNLFDGQAYKFNYFSLGFNNKVLSMTKEMFESSASKDDIIKAFNNLDTRQSIMKLLEAELNKDYKESVKEFERKGLIERLPNGLYKNKSLQLTSETKFIDGIQEQVKNSEEVQDRQIKHLIANFSLNTLLHNIEFSNIFNGDFAQYKPKDLQKRTYQSQAMTVFGNFVNKIIKTVVVKDVEVASESYNSIVNTLKSQGFDDSQIEEIAGKYSEGINVTDAQVYISPEFYKRIHVARGTWTSEMQEAFDIIENGSKGNIKESLHRLLGGIKPYYFGNRFDPKFEKQKFEQVKCAMLPLFKGYCDLNPLLAKKREQMLTDGIDMIAHESSFKAAIGFRNTISDDVEYLKLDLSTDNFGVQVDNPDHMDEGNDSMRQLKMLILGSIDKSKLYNDIKGDVIISNILNMEAENLADSLKELKDKMDVKSNINFAHFIKEMVTKRGATINIEEILNIVNGNFEYALDSGNIATQVENMISSIFTNNVIKQKFSVGGSAVQATALGFKYKNLAEQQDNLPQEALDLQTDLKWIKSEDGKISYIECAMPATSSHFFNKDGTLKDINNIPEELRTFLAYRIPTEGLHSMMPIKVVKFLPPTMGNFILLPYEVTTQFGADFDFDKVYFFGKEFFKDENNNLIPYKYYTGTDKKSTQNRYYQYSYTVSPKEKLNYEDFEELSVKEQNVRAGRNNNIVDNYLTLLTSINNLHLLVSPSGFTQLENFQKTYFPNYDEYNFFSSRTQRDFKERNHIGIALKGQAALHVSGHSYGVLMDLNSTDYNEDGSLDITRSVNINGSNRTNFSGLYTDNGKLIADELASIMAAILDDIKNPLLEPLGINNNTIDVLATIIRSGVNMKTALMFTSQPAVKHLSKILAGNKNKVKDINEGYLQIDDLIDSYTKLAESSLDKLEDKDNPTYQGYIKVMNSNKPEHADINEKDMLNIIETYRIDGDEILKGHSVEGKNKLSFKKATPLELLEYYSYQVRVLNQFKNIESIAKELVKINKFFAINKEVGPNIEDIIAKRDILDNINNSNIVKGFNIDLVPSLKETWSAHEYALDWFESYFPYSTDFYMLIKNLVIKSQSKKSINEVSIEERQYMNNFIRTYTDYNTSLFNNINEEYDYLLGNSKLQKLSEITFFSKSDEKIKTFNKINDKFEFKINSLFKGYFEGYIKSKDEIIKNIQIKITNKKGEIIEKVSSNKKGKFILNNILINEDYILSINDENLTILIKDINNPNKANEKLGNLTYDQIRNNLFIQNIKVVFDPINKVSYLRLKANRLDLQVKNNIIEAFTALYNNKNTKSLAIDLIKHSFLTTGFFRGLNSYSQFISPAILKELGYNDFRKNLINRLKGDNVYLSVDDESRLLDLIIRNNSKDFTKKFDGEMFNVKSTEPLPNKLVTNEALIKASGRLNDMIWYTYNEDGRVLNTPKYISVYDKFNRKPELYIKNDDFSYEKTTILGKPGYLIEINPYINIEKSYLKYNNKENVEDNIEKLNKPILEENIPNEEYEGYGNSLFGEVNNNFTNEDISPEEGTTKNPEDC